MEILTGERGHIERLTARIGGRPGSQDPAVKGFLLFVVFQTDKWESRRPL
jgi:hypothetical protein